MADKKKISVRSVAQGPDQSHSHLQTDLIHDQLGLVRLHLLSDPHLHRTFDILLKRIICLLH